MKEQMPSPGEMKRIQDENMTEDEKKMSEERAATFRAGVEKGHNAAAKIAKFNARGLSGDEKLQLNREFKYEEERRHNREIAEDCGLSDSALALLDGKAMYLQNDAVLYEISADPDLDSAVLSELIDKLPQIRELVVRNFKNCKKENIQKLLERFPKVSIILKGPAENEGDQKKLQRIINKIQKNRPE